uniref:Putative secreted protein n=1 Tax=Anopheles darlingi TaxID=43151 RepID=A0A2M4D1H8_ANODA
MANSRATSMPIANSKPMLLLLLPVCCCTKLPLSGQGFFFLLAGLDFYSDTFSTIRNALFAHYSCTLQHASSSSLHWLLPPTDGIAPETRAKRFPPRSR